MTDPTQPPPGPSLPDGLPPLPEPPAGHRWEYRGEHFVKTVPIPIPTIACFTGYGKEWMLVQGAAGLKGFHYAEAIPTGTPLAQPEADHRDCKCGCLYGLETGGWPGRVCPVGECQHQAREQQPPARADGQAPREWECMTNGKDLVDWPHSKPHKDKLWVPIRVREVPAQGAVETRALAAANEIFDALSNKGKLRASDVI